MVWTAEWDNLLGRLYSWDDLEKTFYVIIRFFGANRRSVHSCKIPAGLWSHDPPNVIVWKGYSFASRKVANFQNHRVVCRKGVSTHSGVSVTVSRAAGAVDRFGYAPIR
jgi:hypothetical protein